MSSSGDLKSFFLLSFASKCNIKHSVTDYVLHCLYNSDLNG